MRQAARKLGLPVSTLSNYVVLKKLPTPKAVTTGKITVYLWTDAEIETARKLLPKIANGRKTRYQKLREKQEAPARVPVPHKKKQTNKKQK
jgi:predicted DNA-binding transcriptional regulator AlpA